MKFMSLFARAHDRGKGPDQKIAAVAILLVAMIGAIDYVTGYEISFSVFYLIPISLATWKAGLRQGLVLSLASGVTWLLVDLYSGHQYSNFLIPYWNAAVRLGFFLVVTLLIHQRRLTMASLRQARAHLEEEVEARTGELRKANEILAFELAVRKRAEEQIRLQAAALGAAANAILITDREGAIVWVNAAFTGLTGYTAEETVGRNPRLLKSGLQPPSFYEQMWNTILAGQTWHGELVNRGKNGSFYPQEMTITPVRGASGRVEHFIAIMQDISERRQNEEALRKSAAEYRHLFESANDAILIFELESEVILQANGRACQMYGFGRDELIGMSLKDLTKDVARGESQLAQLPQEGSIRDFESVHLRKDGTPIEVLTSSSLIEYRGTRAVLSIHRDITEIKRLEQQFRQAQKMEAVGRLAGGVAHDFNNLLNVILGYSELLLESCPPGDPARRKVEEIRKAGERAASLTRQLLAFSRKQILQPTVLDLNSVVAEMEKMLRRLIPEDIALSIVLDPELGRVRADAGQVEQVLLNLVVNAGDAMPRGGKLTIETVNVDLDQAYVRGHPMVQPGPYVMLAVSDTGVGMDAETQSHIFEPFFTTKVKNKGTGLGLATVYGIVKQSGGYVWTYSELGQGTTIKIYLPRIEAAAEPARSERIPALSLTGQETILLVEDEEAVRRLARESLEIRGYTVLEAGDGAEALRLAEQHEGTIHLLLTDVVMPRMSGRELAQRLESSRPRIKVLFMSGYTGEAVLGNNLLRQGQVLLQKPFRPADLARKVRELLDEEGG